MIHLCYYHDCDKSFTMQCHYLPPQYFNLIMSNERELAEMKVCGLWEFWLIHHLAFSPNHHLLGYWAIHFQLSLRQVVCSNGFTGLHWETTWEETWAATQWKCQELTALFIAWRVNIYCHFFLHVSNCLLISVVFFNIFWGVQQCLEVCARH